MNRNRRVLAAAGLLVCVGAPAVAQDAPNATPSPGLHARQGGRNPGTGPAIAGGGMPGAGGPQWSNRTGSLLDRRMNSSPRGVMNQNPQGGNAIGPSGNGFGNVGSVGMTPSQERAAFDEFRERTLATALDVYRPRSTSERLREWYPEVEPADMPPSALVGTYRTKDLTIKVYVSRSFGRGGSSTIMDSTNMIRGAIARGGTTVNDLVFYHEYNNYRNGCDGLISGGCDTWRDPDSAIDGFLAEPTNFEQMYGGLDPATQHLMASSVAPVVPETTLSRADFAFEEDEPKKAVELYREHLGTAPEDVGAKLRMALSMIESGDAADGASLLHAMYQSDPSLADVSLSVLTQEWSAKRSRAIVNRSVTHANRAGSASAWMAVAVLMEAEGRPALASKMVERARGAGLDPVLLSRVGAMIEASK